MGTRQWFQPVAGAVAAALFVVSVPAFAQQPRQEQPNEPTALRQLRELQAKEEARKKAQPSPSASPAQQEQIVRPLTPVPPENDVQPPPQPTPQQQQQLQKAAEQARRAQPAEGGDADQRDLDELMSEQAKLQQQMGALNKVNPVANNPTEAAPMPAPGGEGELTMPQGGLGTLTSLPPEEVAKLPPQVQMIVKLAKNPFFGPKFLKLGEKTRNPEFMKSAMSIAKNPLTKYMYLALLVFTFTMWLMKRRALSATDRFVPRLFLRGAFFVIFMIGYFTISILFLGDPLVKVLVTFKEALL
ncbi:MAG: hypothetical protein HY075_15095 [Deltaproteobacteria bacterium]|nr:hypothetical protein [Deltaproteobacteria bacterium]